MSAACCARPGYPDTPYAKPPHAKPPQRVLDGLWLFAPNRDTLGME